MAGATEQGDQGDDRAGVVAGAWTSEVRIKDRDFPHPCPAPMPLRVLVARQAFAELSQHAKSSLQAEVCGVLIGDIFQDRAGEWLDIKAIIRGVTAQQGSSHVTFTQETWTRIHQERERDYPKLRIIGWYHSHPGFGVEFSDMDIFIHTNFFSGRSQLAFLSDPVSGDDAAAINTGSGIAYLDRVWVDGRERALKRPKDKAASAAEAGPAAMRIDTVEARLAQVLASLDKAQERITTFYITIGMFAVLAIMLFLVYYVYDSYTSRFTPPKTVGQFSMPVRVGDKDVMVGLQVVSWDVPPELNSILLQLAEKEMAEEKAAKAKAEADKAPDGKGTEAKASPPAAGAASAPGSAAPTMDATQGKGPAK